MKIQLEMQSRGASVTPDSVNVDKRTVDLVWSTGSPVARMDWMTGQRYTEVLSLDQKHVRLTRLNNGAPLLSSHNAYDLSSVLGVVEKASVDGKQGIATVRFSERAEVEPIWRDIQSGIIRNVSVGYIVHKFEVTNSKDGSTTRNAIDWEPLEISAVAVGADAAASFRESPRGSICELVDAASCEETHDEVTDIVERESAVVVPALVSEDVPVVTATVVQGSGVTVLPGLDSMRARLALLNSL